MGRRQFLFLFIQCYHLSLLCFWHVLPCFDFNYYPRRIFGLFLGFCHLPKDNLRVYLSVVVTCCHYYINTPSR